MPLRKKPGSKKGQPKPLKRTLDNHFRQRLDAAMTTRGVSIPKLAQLAECSRQVLHKYVNPKYAQPKQIETFLLFRIADALEVSPRWLLLAGQSTMDKERSLGTEENRALNTFAHLDQDARDEWIRQGEFLAQRQPQLIATPANPYANAKAKAKQ